MKQGNILGIRDVMQGKVLGIRDVKQGKGSVDEMCETGKLMVMM